jgi:hypothetical protein
MSILTDLREALRQATMESLRGLTLEHETLQMKKEVDLLKKWLGDRGSEKPSTDAISAALREFIQNPEIKSRGQALLLCHGCANCLTSSGRLIEDDERFPRLLAHVDSYRSNPRTLRRCYRGLLNTYLDYDVGAARAGGKANFERLRDYLRDRMQHMTVPGVQPKWVDVLLANHQLLSDDPGGYYGDALLRGDSEEFDLVRETLAIGDDSWLVWRVVLGQIDAAAKQEDERFRKALPQLLVLLSRHRLAINDGLSKLLERYRMCRNSIENAALRDFAIDQWRNPLLAVNAARWSPVRPETKAMVAGWLKLKLIRKFFGLLAADGVNDTRRLKFWERYHDSIDQVYFGLGRSALRHRGEDYVTVRKEMEGHLFALRSTTSDNNAFIMSIGGHVVVEFGAKGNACYIFSQDKLPFDLNTREITADGMGLKSPHYVDRLTHSDSGTATWEQTFGGVLYRLASVRPEVTVEATPGLQRTRGRPTLSPSETHSAATLTGPFSSSPAPQKPTEPTPLVFTMAALSRFCASHDLQIDDRRTQNGCLWVRTHNVDETVNTRLLAWGFKYKNAFKGWWRE